MSSKNMDLTQGKLLPSIIIYTIPIILTSLLQLFFNAADLVVVGQFGGGNSVGAIGATNAIIHLVINFFIGLSVGSGASVAYFLGAGQQDNVEKTVHTSIPLALGCGIVLTVFGLIFTRGLLQLMNTPAEFIDQSSLYLRIYFAGTIFNLVYNFGAAILRAAGDTRGPLVYLTIAGVLNVILNLLFVIVFKMSVAGVALATIISQAVSAVLVMWALIRTPGPCRFYFSKMRFHKKILARIIGIGVPAGIQSMLFNIANALIQSSVNGLALTYGPAVVTGASAADSLGGFCFVAMNSFTQTALNFVSQNAGAGKMKRIKGSLLCCLLCVFAAGLSTGLITYTFGPQLLSFYIPSTEDSSAITYAMDRIRITVLPYFLCGIMDTFSSSLRGLGYSKTPMIICVLGVCGLRILWIYTVFAQNSTIEVLYFCWPLSWLVTLLAELIAFIILFKKFKAAHPQMTEA